MTIPGGERGSFPEIPMLRPAPTLIHAKKSKAFRGKLKFKSPCTKLAGCYPYPYSDNIEAQKQPHKVLIDDGTWYSAN